MQYKQLLQWANSFHVEAFLAYSEPDWFMTFFAVAHRMRLACYLYGYFTDKEIAYSLEWLQRHGLDIPPYIPEPLAPLSVPPEPPLYQSRYTLKIWQQQANNSIRSNDNGEQENAATQTG